MRASFHGAIRRPGGGAGGGLATSGLVAQYKFDEGTGDVVNDSSGNGHHGQLGSASGSDANDPAWAAEGVEFVTSGSNNYVLLPLNTAMPHSAMTVQWLVNLTSGAGSFGTMQGGNSVKMYFLSNTIYVMQSATNGVIVSAAHTLPTGWQLITFTYTSGAQELLRNTTSIDTDTASLTFTDGTGAGFYIGTTDFFDRTAGKLGYFLVYDRVLSGTEISDNYDAIKAEVAGRGITLP